MRIILDAMGTDARPTPDIMGGIEAGRQWGDEIIFVGDEQRIGAELQKQALSGLHYQVVHAADEVAMEDKPSAILKGKPSSSIHVGLRMLRDGMGDAFVSMGNTGAIHAIATLASVGRIAHVKRPALTVIFPVHGHNVIFLDIGANADAKAEWLMQFGVMGSAYAQTALGVQNPRVATLCNGEEEGKGNHLTKETADLLRQVSTVNYIGHVEPKEILQHKADVVVMDGFLGNIFLKTFEGTVSFFSSIIRSEVKRSWLSMLGATLMTSALNGVRKRLDAAEIGGAPLLGVDGVVIVGHGASESRAVKNAINQARLAVLGRSVSAIKEKLATVQLQESE